MSDGRHSWLKAHLIAALLHSTNETVDISQRPNWPIDVAEQLVVSDARVTLTIELEWALSTDAQYNITSRDSIHVLSPDGFVRLVVPLETLSHADSTAERIVWPRAGRCQLKLPLGVAYECTLAVVQGGQHSGRRLVSTPFSTVSPEFVHDGADPRREALRIDVTLPTEPTAHGSRIDIAVTIAAEVPEAVRRAIARNSYVQLMPAGRPTEWSDVSSALTQSASTIPLRNCIEQGDVWSTALAVPDAGSGVSAYRVSLLCTWNQADEGWSALPSPLLSSSRFELGDCRPALSTDAKQSSILFVTPSQCHVGDEVRVEWDIHPDDLPWFQFPCNPVEQQSPALALSPADKIVFYPYSRSDHLLRLLNNLTESTTDQIGFSSLRGCVTVTAPTVAGRFDVALVGFLPLQAAVTTSVPIEVREPFVDMKLHRFALAAADGGTTARLALTVSGPSSFIVPGWDRVLITTRPSRNVIADVVLPPAQPAAAEAKHDEDDLPADQRDSYALQRRNSTRGDQTIVVVDVQLSGIERLPLRGPAIIEFKSRRLNRTLRRVPVHLDDDEFALPIDISTPPVRSGWRLLPSVSVAVRSFHPLKTNVAVRLAVKVNASATEDASRSALRDAVLVLQPRFGAEADAAPPPPVWRFDADDAAALPESADFTYWRSFSSHALWDKRALTVHFPPPPLGDYHVCCYLSEASVMRYLHGLHAERTASQLEGPLRYRLISYAETRITNEPLCNGFIALPSGTLPVDDSQACPVAAYTDMSTLPDAAVGAQQQLLRDKAEMVSGSVDAKVTSRPASAYRIHEAEPSIPPKSSLISFARLGGDFRAAIIANTHITTADTVVATLHCASGYTPSPTDKILLVDDLWRTVYSSVALKEGTSINGSFALCTVALTTPPAPGVYYCVLFCEVKATAIAFSPGIKVTPHPHYDKLPIQDAFIDQTYLAQISHTDGRPPLQIAARPHPPKTGKPSQTRRGQQGSKVRALLIGVAQFGTAFEIRGPPNDVERLSSVLSKAFGGNLDVTLLHDLQSSATPVERPTAHAIRSATNTLLQSVSEGDAVIWYFSGIGSTVSGLDALATEAAEQCVLPCDATWSRNGLITARECSQWAEDLRAAVGPSGSVTFIIDAGFQANALDSLKQRRTWCEDEARTVVLDDDDPSTLTTYERQRRAAKRADDAAKRVPRGVMSLWVRRDQGNIERRAPSRSMVPPLHLRPSVILFDGATHVPAPFVQTATHRSDGIQELARALTTRAADLVAVASATAPLYVWQASKRISWDSFFGGGNGTCGAFTDAVVTVMQSVLVNREKMVTAKGSDESCGITSPLAPTWSELHRIVCRKLYASPHRSQKPILFWSNPNDSDGSATCALLPPFAVDP